MCNLHWCYTCTALLSANQNRVLFSCILLAKLIDSMVLSHQFSNSSQTMSKCGTNKKVAHKAIALIFANMYMYTLLKK